MTSPPQTYTYRLEKPIVLVGFMGVGKTTLGRLLAQKLGVAFVDSDIAITQAANMSIAEIFTHYGETFFRQREHHVITRLLKDGAQLLSVGGGAFITDETRAMLLKRTTVVWLRADLDLIWSRVKGNQKRPLLQVDNPKAAISALYEKRVSYYECAHIVWDAKAEELKEQAAQRLIDLLLHTPYCGLKKEESK